MVWHIWSLRLVQFGSTKTLTPTSRSGRSSWSEMYSNGILASSSAW